jgi:hypothetical protein
MICVYTYTTSAATRAAWYAFHTHARTHACKNSDSRTHILFQSYDAVLVEIAITVHSSRAHCLVVQLRNRVNDGPNRRPEDRSHLRHFADCHLGHETSYVLDELIHFGLTQHVKQPNQYTYPTRSHRLNKSKARASPWPRPMPPVNNMHRARKYDRIGTSRTRNKAHRQRDGEDTYVSAIEAMGHRRCFWYAFW